MASIGHVAIGMAAARVYEAPRWSSMAWSSALSLVPDADVVGFSLGVEYGDPSGHRGATHSLTFAIALADGCRADGRSSARRDALQPRLVTFQRVDEPFGDGLRALDPDSIVFEPLDVFERRRLRRSHRFLCA